MISRNHQYDNHIRAGKDGKKLSKVIDFFKTRKKPTAIALAIIVAAVGVWQGAGYALARFNLSRAVHFNQQQLNNVEPATLLVGTHLIHISVINNQIYEVAEISQSDTGQSNLYYKSEIGDGQWYEISNASALADISNKGTPVSDSEILALGLTNETRSDAITYDLASGNPICPYNTTDPYDIKDLTETMGLQKVYDYDRELIDNDSETDSILYEFQAIEYFFNYTAIRNDLTNLCDNTIAQLHQFYLNEAYQKIPLQELVQILVAEEYIDHERRALVMQYLNANGTNDLVARLSTPSRLPYPYNENFPDEEIEDDREIFSVRATSQMGTEAAADAFASIQESYASHNAQKLVQGKSILAQCQYADLQYLYYNVSGGGFNRTSDVNTFFKHGSTGETNIQRLAAMENISESVVGYRRDLEKSILTDELVPFGTNTLRTKTTSGAGDTYNRLAADAETTNETRDAALSDQKSDAESTRMELQFFITNLRDRMNDTDMITYIDARLDEANDMYAAVKEDAYADYGHEVVQAYIDFLEALKADIENGMGGGNDELEALLDEYQDGYQSALDNNDLGEADRYAALMQAVADQMVNGGGSGTGTGGGTGGGAGDGSGDGSGDGTGDGTGGAGDGSRDGFGDGTGDGTGGGTGDGSGSGTGGIGDGSGSGTGGGSGTGTGGGSGTGTGGGSGDGAGDGSGSGTGGTGDGTGGSAGDGSGSGTGGGSGTGTGGGSGSGSGSGGRDTTVSDLMNNLANALGEGNSSQVLNDINALSAMSAMRPEQVSKALNEAKSRIAGSTEMSDEDVQGLLDAVGDAIADGQDNFSGKITADDLANLLNSLFGADFGSLSDGQKVALIKATTDFGATYNNEFVTNYGLGKLAEVVAEENPYVYVQPTEITPEYLDLEHIAAVTSYRYVFNASETRATLSDRGEYYSFVAYEDTYEDAGGEIKELKTPLTFRKTVYLDEDSSDEIFNCVAYYVPDTEYGIVVTDQIEEWASQIMEMLVQLL